MQSYLDAKQNCVYTLVTNLELNTILTNFFNDLLIMVQNAKLKFKKKFPDFIVFLVLNWQNLRTTINCQKNKIKCKIDEKFDENFLKFTPKSQLSFCWMGRLYEQKYLLWL